MSFLKKTFGLGVGGLGVASAVGKSFLLRDAFAASVLQPSAAIFAAAYAIPAVLLIGGSMLFFAKN